MTYLNYPSRHRIQCLVAISVMYSSGLFSLDFSTYGTLQNLLDTTLRFFPDQVLVTYSCRPSRHEVVNGLLRKLGERNRVKHLVPQD